MKKLHPNFFILRWPYFLVLTFIIMVFLLKPINLLSSKNNDTKTEIQELNLAHMELNSYYFSDNDLNSTRFGIKKASEIISRYDLFILGLPEDINSSEISYILSSIKYQFSIIADEGISYSSISFNTNLVIYYKDILNLESVFSDESSYYAVHMKSKNRDLDFALMGINNFEKLLNLDIYVKEVEKIWNENLIVIMGNLYADCDYIDEKSLNIFPIMSKDYVWVIPDSNCTYSQIIVTDDFETIAEKGRTYKTDQNLSDYIVEFSFVTEAFDPL